MREPVIFDESDMDKVTCLRSLGILSVVQFGIGAIKMSKKTAAHRELGSYNRCFAWGLLGSHQEV